MSVDYDGVGGIGIELTDEVLLCIIDKGIFTEYQWEDDRHLTLESLGLSFSEAGSYYSGNLKQYLFVDGNNLKEVYQK